MEELGGTNNSMFFNAFLLLLLLCLLEGKGKGSLLAVKLLQHPRYVTQTFDDALATLMLEKTF